MAAVLAVALLALAIAIGAFVVARRFAAPSFVILTADETHIRDHAAERLTVFRMAGNPRIIVLDFPDLLEQGEMLDRIAALTEKAGLPRDTVLAEADLAAVIRASGDTIATWYYGHDYPASAIQRFFFLAAAGHVALNPEERRLRALARQLGWLRGHPNGALISLSRAGADPNVTPTARAAILHHELSHGAFFTEPRYAAYTREFWRTTLTKDERAAFRRFLGSQGYDTSNEELMLNEMQAYLVFTQDPAFFTCGNVDMTQARRDELVAKFRDGMPR